MTLYPLRPIICASLFCLPLGAMEVTFEHLAGVDYAIEAVAAKWDSVWVATSAGLVLCDTMGEKRATYSREGDGPRPTAQCMQLDGHGHVWLGTSRGAMRFDGEAWWRLDSSNGLPCNEVTAMAVDSLNNVWLATACGVAKFHDDGLTAYTVKSLHDVTTITAGLDSTVWFGTAEGWIVKYDGNQWYEPMIFRWNSYYDVCANKYDEILRPVTGIVIDTGATKWFGTEQGLIEYTYTDSLDAPYEGAEAHDTPPGLRGTALFFSCLGTEAIDYHHQRVTTMGRGRRGRIWIEGDSCGFYHDSLWTRVTNPGGDMSLTQDGAVWGIRNHSGTLDVRRFRQGSWELFCKWDDIDYWLSPLPPPRLYSYGFLTASSEHLWIAGWDNVLSYDGSKWVQHIESLPTHSIFSVFCDSTATTWVGHMEGVSRYNGSEWKHFTHNGEHSELRAIESISYDPLTATLWVTEGVNEKLLTYDGETWQSYDSAQCPILAHGAPECPSIRQTEILSDTAGNTWYSLSPKGVMRYDGRDWEIYDTTNGLCNNEVSAMALDSCGNMWFAGAYSGVSKFDGTTWTTFDTSSGLRSQEVTDMTASPGGVVWLATPGGLVAIIDTVVSTYSTEDGLLSDTLSIVECGPAGNIWIKSADTSNVVTRATYALTQTTSHVRPRSPVNAASVRVLPAGRGSILVQVSARGRSPIKLQAFSLGGRLVKEKEWAVSPSTNRLRISGLGPGLYSIVVSWGGQVTQRIPRLVCK